MDRTPTPGAIVRLTQGIADLNQAVQELSVRVTNLEVRQPLSLWRWALVEPARRTVEAYYPPYRLHQADCGAPDIPPRVLDLVQTVAANRSRRELRGRRAFRLGFFARACINCVITYQHTDHIEEEDKFWFVFLINYGISFQFIAKEDVNRFLVGPGGHQCPSVVQGFATEEELEVFCIGGDFQVPALLTWKLVASHSQTRETLLY